ncbi:hypothetical protein [Ideonella sp.]|uniref:hypothetical protein n=1 Tax=Ideonella sp. TaxID=1929293 RepID=UPI002B461852|nr:hypothetical protein [Ideonella sp.]HJV71155.1 hypothetical protein [Ideonella sp.]
MGHSQRFCVIAQARTGSEYLTTRLNEHPEIACHRELFNRHTVYSALTGEFKARLPSIEERDAQPLVALEQVAALSDQAFPAKRLFGFKLFLKHHPDVRQHVRADPRYRLIVLERGNKLAQFVSTQTARTTGQWTALATKGGEPKVTGKGGAAADAAPAAIEVDIDHLARFVELSTKRYANFNQRIAGRAGVMHLQSETLDERFVEVLEFLGVDVSPELRIVRLRQNPTPLATRVSNWEAVVAWLDRHGHADWTAG